MTDISRGPPRRLRVRRGHAEAALATLLGLQLAYSGWLLASPPTVPQRPAPATQPASLPLDVFFRRGAAAEGAGAADLNLTLFGTRSVGGEASAIISGPDGRQRVVGVGEDIAPGARLLSVAGDHVTIAAGSGVRRLDFMPFSAAAPSAPAPPAAAARRTGAPPEVVADAGVPTVREAGHPVADYMSALRPHRRDGRTLGYVWRPGRGLDVLAAAGLRPGDVLVGLNGMEFNNPERVQELADEVSLRRPIQVRFERDGRVQTITFTPSP